MEPTDGELVNAWRGTQWEMHGRNRCAVVAFGSEYGKLLRPVEARIMEYLTPAFVPDPVWIGFTHSAVKGRRAVTCRVCGRQFFFGTSNFCLHVHRRTCPLPE